MTNYQIIFPAEADTLEGAEVAEFEAESLVIVSRANSLAARANGVRGEYRALLEEQVKHLLWESCQHPGLYRGGAAPRVVVAEVAA